MSSIETTATPRDPDCSPAQKVHVGLHGVPETLFLCVVARHLDAQRPSSLLRDKWATRLLSECDFDVTRAECFPPVFHSIVSRALLLDTWLGNFLARHRENGQGATVLHLACGLDSRHLRVPWTGETSEGQGKVRWIDVDLPEVIELREKLYADEEIPTPAGADKPDYRLLATSVTDPDWLGQIPTDRPVIVIVEGLFMYLEFAEVQSIFTRICARFPLGGEIIFDVLGSFATKTQRHTSSQFSRMQAVFRTAVDDVRVFETRCQGEGEGEESGKGNRIARLVEVRTMCETKGFERLRFLTRVAMTVCYYLPYLGTISQNARYRFGKEEDFR